jgi:hypothetical protein
VCLGCRNPRRVGIDVAEFLASHRRQVFYGAAFSNTLIVFLAHQLPEGLSGCQVFDSVGYGLVTYAQDIANFSGAQSVICQRFDSLAPVLNGHANVTTKP